ncbi:MAG: Nif3-like dinuclear metal center hexameric protein [Balneolales bacterium]
MSYTNNHILEFLEEWAPQSTKLDFDNVGLLVGDDHQEVGKVITCLDVTSEVVDEAISVEADLIIAHHPLIFKKLSRITPSDITGSLLYRLIQNNISLIAVHTNLDAAYGGVSFVMAERLGLQNTRFLKVEEAAETAGFGAIGELPETLDVDEFLELVREKLDSRGIRYSGYSESIRRVAVCGGAGAFLAEEAIRSQADAYVTADLKYHDFFTESPSSFLLVDAGHYESEVPIVGTLCNKLKNRFPEVEVLATKANTNPVVYYSKTTNSIKTARSNLKSYDRRTSKSY